MSNLQIAWYGFLVICAALGGAAIIGLFVRIFIFCSGVPFEEFHY